MQIKFMVDEREIQLGCEALESLVGNLPDEDESLGELFHELAQSNIAGVRASVARKSVISAETVAILASDSSPEVIEALVHAQRGKLSDGQAPHHDGHAQLATVEGAGARVPERHLCLIGSVNRALGSAAIGFDAHAHGRGPMRPRHDDRSSLLGISW